MRASCGSLLASTMKDGWAYATGAGSSLPLRWQFPQTTASGLFYAGDPWAHGDTRYHRSGAAWQDVFIGMMGGQDVVPNVLAGYRRLHGLNVCAGGGGRVRWMSDVPSIGLVSDPRQTTMSPPSVTGGIVFVGTDQGHLVVFADPAIWPSQGLRCVRDGLDIQQCQAQGFALVPQPTVLADIDVARGQIIAEPAIAGGRVFVATTGGRVVMLEPK
jgi:hypothetical protein